MPRTRSATCESSHPDYLTTEEVAHLLRIAVRTLENWRAKRVGPPWSCHGRRVVYRREAVLSWLAHQEAKRAGGTSEPLHTKPVTACPYLKDPSRWHVDMTFSHPTTNKDTRLRRVAPAGLSLEGAIAWGQGERLRIVTKLARVKPAEEEKEETFDEKKKSRKRVLTLADYWPLFEAGHIAHQKYATQCIYLERWRLYIREAFGHLRMDEIDASVLAKFRTELQGRGLKSAKGIVQTVRTALTWAREQGYLPASYNVPKLKWPKKGKVDKPIYHRGDLDRLLAAAKTDEQRVFILLLEDLALRIGEAAGLKWTDIDLVRGTATIRRNVCKCRLQDSPKGEIGTLPLSPRLLSSLRSFPRRGDFILRPLGRSTKEHASDRNLAARICKMQLRAGLPVYGAHRIRHSVLSLAAQSGVNPHALQAWARHSKMATTMEYYVHLDKVALAAQAIAAMTGSTPTPPGGGNGPEALGSTPRIALVA